MALGRPVHNLLSRSEKKREHTANGLVRPLLRQRQVHSLDVFPVSLMPYSLSLRYNVVFPMPSCRAIDILSPFKWLIALRIACFSRSAIGNTGAEQVWLR